MKFTSFHELMEQREGSRGLQSQEVHKDKYEMKARELGDEAK